MCLARKGMAVVMTINRAQDSFKRKLHYDVVVVGGGIAGIIAAASASSIGMNVLLIEAATFLGGVVTMGPLEALMTFHDSQQQVIAGMAGKFLEVLHRYDPKAVPVEDTTGYCTTILPYDAEMMKLSIGIFLREYGVHVMTETILADVQLESRTLSKLVLQTKTGQVLVETGAVVDCSGMGICAYLAGNGLYYGNEDGKSQPVTVLGKIGGVDLPLLKEYVRQNAQDFKCFTGKLNLDTDFLHLWGFGSVLKKGYEEKALSLFRQEMHVMQTSRENEVVINFSRINTDPMDAQMLSASQTEGYEQVYQLFHYFKGHIPAFRKAFISQCGYVGIRENGRIKGRYVLSRNDIMAGTRFPTVVARGAFPIDIHEDDASMKFERIIKAYDIPMECLHAESIDNLFIGGRCVSSTFEANGSCRISATCMATGHAAGLMAAIYVKDGQVQYGRVVNCLQEQGAIIE